MAKKKENKAIGYVILSFIPLFGIVWAAVAGVQHNGFVKEAREAETKFEEKFLEVVNNNEYVKAKNIRYENLNITCALPSFYNSKIKYDKTEGFGSSYSVTLSANPYTKDGRTDYELVYEFFITSEDYDNLIKSYDREKVTIMGVSDYVYETYYPHNPKSSPIYAIEPLFDKYKDNLFTLICNDDILVGISAESVINSINNIPEDVKPTEKDLKAYDKLLSSVELEYSILSETIKLDVTNYDKLLAARSIYNVRRVNYLVEEFPSNKEDYKLSLRNDVQEAYDIYVKLTEEEKSKVYNIDLLEKTTHEYTLWLLDYYMVRVPEVKCSYEDKNFSKYRTTILQLTNTFNDRFTEKEIKVIKENGKLDLLIQYVEELNSIAQKDHEKLKLNLPEEDFE